ncbi:hypothetical protein OU995_19705 [Roseateles sp. SL47]|uniref:hypothetical protein n=1 Tax=Roseateles sp. SL47 TaxID=2995138 RepID=UPI00226EB33C|nr:hypothetical protein [Roseateles sp. SL47]WAC71794.1 hypothetical protein OU995_19705 [Roseateles sp. SL47]
MKLKLLTQTSTTALVTAGAVISAVMMVAAPAFAASAVGKSSAASTYEKERAACLAGRTGQDKTPCLKEAAAARDEARRGHLKTASEEELANNAMLRCQRVAEEDRQDCRAMVLGQGTREGSLQNGGILKRIDRMVEENPTGAGAAPNPPTLQPPPVPPVPPAPPAGMTPERPKAPPRPLPPASAASR